MEVENPDDDGPAEPIITIEEEEEVVLFWENGHKNKGIRELAMGAAEKIKDDKEILIYYRFVPLSIYLRKYCCGCKISA